MSSSLKESLSRLAACYNLYADRLVPWISSVESAKDIDKVISSLSELETEFIDKAKMLGEEVEAKRIEIRKNEEKNIKLYDAVISVGAEQEFNEASSAVHQVAALRVSALREMEKIKEKIRLEILKNNSARTLNKKYNRNERKGRRVDGKI